MTQLTNIFGKSKYSEMLDKRLAMTRMLEMFDYSFTGKDIKVNLVFTTQSIKPIAFTNSSFICISVNEDSPLEVICKAFNLHELGHILYSYNSINIHWNEAQSRARMVLEDQRIEWIMAHKWPATRKYFVYLATELIKGSPLLLWGRRFMLPYGVPKPINPRMADIIDEYMVETSLRKRYNLVEEFAKLLDEDLPPVPSNHRPGQAGDEREKSEDEKSASKAFEDLKKSQDKNKSEKDKSQDSQEGQSGSSQPGDGEGEGSEGQGQGESEGEGQSGQNGNGQDSQKPSKERQDAFDKVQDKRDEVNQKEQEQDEAHEDFNKAERENYREETLDSEREERQKSREYDKKTDELNGAKSRKDIAAKQSQMLEHKAVEEAKKGEGSGKGSGGTGAGGGISDAADDAALSDLTSDLSEAQADAVRGVNDAIRDLKMGKFMPSNPKTIEQMADVLRQKAQGTTLLTTSLKSLPVGIVNTVSDILQNARLELAGEFIPEQTFGRLNVRSVMTPNPPPKAFKRFIPTREDEALISLILYVDRSGSMRDNDTHMLAPAVALALAEAARDNGSEVYAIAFNQSPSIMSLPHEKGIRVYASGGDTTISPAIDAGIAITRDAMYKKVQIVITDGDIYDEETIIRMRSMTDLNYVILVGTGSKGAAEAISKLMPCYHMNKIQDLPMIMTRIMAQLMNDVLVRAEVDG